MQSGQDRFYLSSFFFKRAAPGEEQVEGYNSHNHPLILMLFFQRTNVKQKRTTVIFLLHIVYAAVTIDT
jgi:hypothetical protein